MSIINKRIKIIEEYSKLYNIPTEVCIGIYKLESTYRPIFFRILENASVIVHLILNFMFKMPIKNYTIGCMQLGLATILTYTGTPTYEHYKQICKVSFDQAIEIIKAMFPRTNIRISCLKIKDYYRREYVVSSREIGVTIGKLYNGNYVYGLKLQSLIEKM